MARNSEAELFDELLLGNQCCPKNKTYRRIRRGQVIAYFVSETHKFANGGGYIPCSDKYGKKRVYVVVLKEKLK